MSLRPVTLACCNCYTAQTAHDVANVIQSMARWVHATTRVTIAMRVLGLANYAAEAYHDRDFTTSRRGRRPTADGLRCSAAAPACT